MFDTLFKCKSTITRHENGPLAKERKQFLDQCKEKGYPPVTLSKIAWILISVADQIDINSGKMSAHDIESVVDNWKRFKHVPIGTQNSGSSRKLFIHFTTEWMRSLGCFEAPAAIECTFLNHIEIFARYLRDERGLSPITIATRCQRLTWFFTSVQTRHASMHTISISDVDIFIEAKGHQGWKRASLACLVGDLRSFFYYAEGQNWCPIGIAAVIESPRLYAQEGIPEAPCWEDVQRLLASTLGDEPADIRDHAILMLLAIYGFRRGEVAQLQLDDIDWTNEQIMLSRPKQRCVQRYPLLPVVGEAILRYLREVRPRSVNRTLFFNLSAPIRPLSAMSITAIAHMHLKKMDIDLLRRGAHCLRHACARHLLSSGFSLKQIGDYLGHRNANSVLSYTKIDLTGLRQVAEFDLRSLL